MAPLRVLVMDLALGDGSPFRLMVTDRVERELRVVAMRSEYGTYHAFLVDDERADDRLRVWARASRGGASLVREDIRVVPRPASMLWCIWEDVVRWAEHVLGG